jgi:hypothetical protein
MRQAILDGALQPQHHKAGLKLVQIRDDILSLQTRNGHRVAYFSVKAPILDVRRAANEWMMHTDQISFVR